MDDMHENDPQAVWDIARKVGVSMFVTRSGDELEGRPLQAYPERDAGLIFFMTDSDRVLSQLATDARVMLSFADKGANNYAAIDGTAIVTNDRAKIKDLWNVWAEAFWDSADDPAIRIVQMTPEHARYWDAPNALVTTMSMVASAVTGNPPKLGKSGDVEM